MLSVWLSGYRHFGDMGQKGPTADPSLNPPVDGLRWITQGSKACKKLGPKKL